jgi:hypothetical protein
MKKKKKKDNNLYVQQSIQIDRQTVKVSSFDSSSNTPTTNFIPVRPKKQ